METRAFGSTGLRVSALGFGAGQIGGDALSEDDAGRLLNEVLDAGVTLFDTARSYGRSEERIGRHLAHRRDAFVLSTKCGYGVAGVPDWTYDAVARGVDEALARLRTDRIDVMHLHSCPRETLERGDVVRALEDARRAGKIRAAAYSGENEALDYAVDCGAFQSIQCSVNLFDERALDGAIARAAARGMGVIGKRPLANAPWRFAERPVGEYCEAYWERMQSLVPDLRDPDWPSLALRFAAFAPGVSCVIAGTASRRHLESNVAIAREGALPARVAESLRAWFRANDRGWRGEI
jgi:aryl-alcohol dehydrogenase-like predicted oxidoreductase